MTWLWYIDRTVFNVQSRCLYVSLSLLVSRIVDEPIPWGSSSCLVHHCKSNLLFLLLSTLLSLLLNMLLLFIPFFFRSRETWICSLLSLSLTHLSLMLNFQEDKIVERIEQWLKLEDWKEIFLYKKRGREEIKVTALSTHTFLPLSVSYLTLSLGVTRVCLKAIGSHPFYFLSSSLYFSPS